MPNSDYNKLPFHVAIIPDGNRHWARERKLFPWEGHEQGAKNTEKIVREALKIGVKCLSFWGSSLENLKKSRNKSIINSDMRKWCLRR